MVLSHPFNCPTQVIEGEAFATLAALMRGRSLALVTSAGWIKRGLPEKLRSAGLEPAAVLADVEANPTVATIERLAAAIPGVASVVALGGGSVIDAAKGAVALKALNNDHALMRSHLLTGAPLPAQMKPLALIAVPTTAGTGSEVTRWGTIWGTDLAKYSVTDARLYPAKAILDPALLLSMPRSLALASGLDALSHAMEAVWNRRHGALTDALAQSAIALLYRNLAASLDHAGSMELARTIQTAALLAGLAMGTTQTALAHSISYPFTARFGLPHGIACSFTLPEVARYNLSDDPERLGPIARSLECDVRAIPEVLERWFDGLGLAREVSKYVAPSAVDEIGDNLITPARAANNLRAVDAAAAKKIAATAIERLLAVV